MRITNIAFTVVGNAGFCNIEGADNAPWADRIADQLQEALAAVDMVAGERWRALPDAWTHGAIGAAVAWGFIRFTIPDVVAPDAFPALAAHAARCEATELFKHWPIDRASP